jgi:hypothetical protein
MLPLNHVIFARTGMLLNLQLGELESNYSFVPGIVQINGYSALFNLSA